jgi:hypothetical protein
MAIEKAAKNWHIISLAFGLIVSLWLHFDPRHSHDIEFAQESFEAIATVVAEYAEAEE